jgi:signal transduction histidine kinase
MLGANGPTSHRKARTRTRRIWHRFSDRTPLRTKLIAAVLALVVMALAAISITSVILVRANLTQQQDGTIKDLFNHYMNGSPIPSIEPDTVYTNGSGQIMAVQEPGNQLASQSSSNQGFPGFGNNHPRPTAPSVPLLPTSRNWAGSDGGLLIAVPAQTGGDTWRIIAETGTYLNPNTNEVTTVTFLIAADLGPINADIQRLAVVDLIVSGAIVIVLAMVAIAVIATNLRPLNEIEMTAGEIAMGHLNHRIPERDPRTEIGRLGRSLNTMLSQVEHAFHAQEASERAAHQSEERMRRFIADASHELRTPLTTIRGFAAHYRQRGGAVGSRHGVGVGLGAESQARSFGTDPFVPNSAPSSSYSGPGEDGMSAADLDHLMGRVESEATRMGMLVEDPAATTELRPRRRADACRRRGAGRADRLSRQADRPDRRAGHRVPCRR